MADNAIVVLDVGKTMAKLSLWTNAGMLIVREVRANARIDAGPYVALDAEGIEGWMKDTLADFAQTNQIASIVPVGHGAAAALIRNGRLACPPMDYEETIGDTDRELYEAERAPFAETGSPSLPDGLNLGAQLYHLERLRPELFTRDTMILPWPQYWAWRLTGVAASEVTSLGCHTDLWSPATGEPSRLARRHGWAALMPPLRRAADVLGTVTAEWQRDCGLAAGTRVHCGLHDSNAALLAARGFREIAENESTVLSTGTWFVAMRTPADGVSVPPSCLAEARDCLVNVDAFGKSIPSSRFMGGREIELLTGADTRRIDMKPDQQTLLNAVPDLIASGSRVLPTFAPGFGPFPDHRGRWIDMPADDTARRTAVSIYAALVADVSLGQIGARERILVEGRFAEAEVFVRALASLRPNDAIYRSNAHNDVSYGALRLLDPSLQPTAPLDRVRPLDVSLDCYRELWRRDVERLGMAA